MQSSPPAADDGGGGAPIPPPAIGAAPLVKAEGGPTVAAGAPLTGGNGEALLAGAAWPLGNGAGNAPCAKACPAARVAAATVSGTIRRRIIKGVSPARSSKAPRV